MSKQNYCLTPEEERYAKACLTLAKRWGLIDDDSFSALDYQTDAALRQALAKPVQELAERALEIFRFFRDAARSVSVPVSGASSRGSAASTSARSERSC